MQIPELCTQDANLVKVGGEPVHDDIEGVMEGKIVDDDGPDCGLSQHAQPWCSWCPSLLFRFSRSQWDGCKPAGKIHGQLDSPEASGMSASLPLYVSYLSP